MKEKLPLQDVDLGVWEYPIRWLIVLGLLAFALETLPDLSPELRTFLAGFDHVCAWVFTVEYICRLMHVQPRRAYASSFFGIVDLLAILPYYLEHTLGLAALHPLRHLRLFRMLKLTRYSRATRLFLRAFHIARDELRLFLVTAGIMLYLAGVGIYYFEHPTQPHVFRSIFDGLWWSVATLTTVGYGDAYPITPAGRLFTFVILIIGLGIIAVPTGMVASALAKARSEVESEPGDAE